MCAERNRDKAVERHCGQLSFEPIRCKTLCIMCETCRMYSWATACGAWRCVLRLFSGRRAPTRHVRATFQILHARPVGGPLVPTLALLDQPWVLGPLVLVEAHRGAVSLGAARRGAREAVLLVRAVGRLAARTLLDQPRVLGALVLVEADGGGVRLRQEVVSSKYAVSK